MFKLFYVREMTVRPIEESKDRIVSAANSEDAHDQWAAEFPDEMPYSITELPPANVRGVMDWQTLRLIERL